MIRVGIRAHDMGKYEVSEFPKLLNLITNLDGECIQLALGKSFIDFKPIKENLTDELGNYLKKELENANIKLSVLGCYINMDNPDREKRYEEIEKFKAHLDFSKHFKDCVVGTETGCLTSNPEDAWNTFMDTLKNIVSYAEKTNTTVAIEGVKKHTVSTPEKMRLVLDSLQSKNLKVIFDPTNFLDFSNYKELDQIIEKSFELFADKIKIIHLKDFIIENNSLKVVTIGKGLFNTHKLFEYIKKYNLNVDILLENSTIETAKDCVKLVNINL